MVEDTKEQTPSQDSPSDAEKKQASVAMPPVRPVATVTAASTPPRPAPVPPRPQPQAPPPAAQPAQQKPTDRRLFIKLLVFISAILAVIPFVPWGNFLLSSVSSSGAYQRQLAVLDMNTTTNRNANGAVAGKKVNVKDLTSFPPNGSWVFTYPTSGDLTTDSQNPDSFQKYQLIRLPAALGGSNQSATAFVAYSKVCVHLWCSPNYDPQKDNNPAHETYQCPCHGSIYQCPTKDPSTGKLVDAGLAIAGPASVQPAPTNAIPMLTLTADPNGDLYIEPPEWDVDHNGVLGYGRNADSYQNYIYPKASGSG
jgi:rieske iron-sulfur protein